MSAYPALQRPVSGTITTQNLVPGGAATANSAVEIDLQGLGTLGIQVTGTYTGALSVQVTLNGTAWVTMAGVPILNIAAGNLATITSALQGIFQVDVAGFAKARVTALAAVTGTATVSLLATTATGMVALDSPIPTGANVIGQVTQSGTWTQTLAASSTITPVPLATQGYSTYHKLIAAATTNATSVKASAGTIGMLILCNTSAAIKYFKLYNKASAPTVGTDVPVFSIAVQPNNTFSVEVAAMGLRMSTGIAYALTGAQADADTTALTAGDVVVNMVYI